MHLGAWTVGVTSNVVRTWGFWGQNPTKWKILCSRESGEWVFLFGLFHPIQSAIGHIEESGYSLSSSDSEPTGHCITFCSRLIWELLEGTWTQSTGGWAGKNLWVPRVISRLPGFGDEHSGLRMKVSLRHGLAWHSAWCCHSLHYFPETA